MHDFVEQPLDSGFDSDNVLSVLSVLARIVEVDLSPIAQLRVAVFERLDVLPQLRPRAIFNISVCSRWTTELYELTARCSSALTCC